MVESLEWATDVFQAKTAEQRAGLRSQPRRAFHFSHTFRDGAANAARSLVRAAQADGGFWVPDWPQAQAMAAVTPGAGVRLPVRLDYLALGDRALLWSSDRAYELVDVTVDSLGVTADVARRYRTAQFVPVWAGDSPEGLSLTRLGAGLNAASLEWVLTESAALPAARYPQYRGHDVLADCPVLGGGTLDESTTYDLSTLDNWVGHPLYLRRRNDAVQTLQMRWHSVTDVDQFALRQWLYARKGRLKFFWLSSRARDFAPLGLAGARLTVLDEGLVRPAPFDVELVIGGVSHYRQVTAVGTPAGTQATIALTLNTAVPGVTADQITRISMLYGVRHDADRVELEHAAGAGMAVQVPVREVPIP